MAVDDTARTAADQSLRPGSCGRRAIALSCVSMPQEMRLQRRQEMRLERRVECWLQDSLVRAYPTAEGSGPSVLHLEAARGERVSLLLRVRSRSDHEVLRVRAIATPPRGLAVRIRRVGFVPLAHHSTETEPRELDCRGRVPGCVRIPVRRTGGRRGAQPVRGLLDHRHRPAPVPAGRVILPLTVEESGVTAGRLHAVIFARDPVIAPVAAAMSPARGAFPVFTDLRSDALVEQYGLSGFDARYWRVAAAYMENIAAHGVDGVSVPAPGPGAAPHGRRIRQPTADGMGRGQPLRVPRAVPWNPVVRLAGTRRAGTAGRPWSRAVVESPCGPQGPLRIPPCPGHSSRGSCPVSGDSWKRRSCSIVRSSGWRRDGLRRARRGPCCGSSLPG